MDNKRLALAIILSVLLFLGWNYMAVQLGWIPEQKTTQTQSANSTSPQPLQTGNNSSSSASQTVAPTASQDIPPAGGFFPADKDATVVVETPLYRAVFLKQGAVLKEFSILQYRQNHNPGSPNVNLVSDIAERQAPLALLVNNSPSWQGTNWTVEGGDMNLKAGDSGTITFTGDMLGMKVSRVFSFHGDSYLVTEHTSVASDKAVSLNLAYTMSASSLAIEERPSILARLKHFFLGGTPPVAEESQYNFTRVAWVKGDSFAEEHSHTSLPQQDPKNPEKNSSLRGNVRWMGIMNNYFLGAISVEGAESVNASARFNDGAFTTFVWKKDVLATPDKPAEIQGTYFMGPKEAKVLGNAPNDLSRALDYGWFTIIAKPLIYLLQFFYGFTHNYGISIILMTLVIKVLFWPLSRKSYKSMEGMRKIQPLMAEIREKYKDDRETMNKEMMALYKRHKVNPAGGCLPILVQIPVFFGLYRALLNAIELRHAPFISHIPFTDIPWLQDLAAADPYCITPIIMGITMVVQQRLTPMPGDPTQAKIMMFMPVIFTVLFLGFPSGLVLYWLTNNVISIGQQWSQLRGKK